MVIVKFFIRQLNIVERQSGFTFNEILVAMSVIAVAVLGYSLSTVGVMRGNRVADNSTVALNLAQDKIEQLRAQQHLLNDDRCPAAGDHGLTATGEPGGIFDRCWKIIDSPLGANLKQIDVTVSWRDYEDHEVTLTTLLYNG